MRWSYAATLALITALSPIGAMAGDPETIINWAPVIGQPGPEPPIDLPRLQSYLSDANKPVADIQGIARVHLKDGSEVGCETRGEVIVIIPETPYTLWLVRTMAIYSRTHSRSLDPWQYPDAPRILWPRPPGEPSIVRLARCGRYALPGAFRYNRLPIGRYLLVGEVNRFGPGSDFYYDYTPNGDGTYDTTSHGGSFSRAIDTYDVYSSLDVAKPGVLYQVPPFQVLYHKKDD